MTYVRSYADWKNSPDTSTPITEAALDNMDAGIYAAHYDTVVQSTVAGAVPVTIKGVVSQSASLLRIQDSAATDLVTFTAAEKLTFRGDTTLYRSAADTLKTDDSLVVGLAADTQNRFKIVAATGNQEWGSGTSVADTNLYRLQADQLKTDDLFIANQGLVSGSFTTSQRNAIVAGMAPKGTIILNTDTSKYEFNSGTDGARTWVVMEASSGIPLSTVTTSQDLIVGTGASTVTRLGVGSNTQVLTVTGGAVGWATPAVSAVVPTGGIIQYGAATAPANFLLCDGTAVNRTTYAALFAVISTLYGVGDGSTTFNLPDLRGRVPVGYATTGGHANVSTLGGNDGTALASRRTSHSHSHTLSISGGSHGHSSSGSGSSDAQGTHGHGGSFVTGASLLGVFNTTGSGTAWSGGTTCGVSSDGNHSHNISVSVTTSANTHTHPNGEFSGAVGLTGVTDTPSYITLNYIIKT